MGNTATQQIQGQIALNATVDQSANQGCFQKPDTSVDGGCLIATAGVKVIGVLQNKPTAGQEANISNIGIVKVIAGAGVTRGADVMSDSSGHAITATGAVYVAGIALTSASAGVQIDGTYEMIEVLLNSYKQAS